MSNSTQSSCLRVHVQGLGRPIWLPPTGHGNHVPDTAWIAILDLSCAEAADDLLAEFAQRRVPAYTAPVRPTRPDTHRVWVGAGSYGTAVNLLVQILPGLISRRGQSVIR
ncbi:hypothetical protein GCM10011575_42130 [Microlunatus endophyticus]|uniref:Uncharacterized protein n=1 Tax=Microlunatus endophyticus TaxID=1716077 RepID=A0A917SGK7_9ACTN|nr:hypothetical protein GCM10011575_42130 [Microlunatus endophyticus]